MNSPHVLVFDYQFRGVTDEVTDCSACGRTNLKRTVVLRPADSSEYVHMGSDCASRALGARGHKITARQVWSLALRAQRQLKEARERASDLIGRYGPVYNAPVALQARTFYGFNPHMKAKGLSATNEIHRMLSWAYEVMGWELPAKNPAPRGAWSGTTHRAPAPASSS